MVRGIFVGLGVFVEGERRGAAAGVAGTGATASNAPLPPMRTRQPNRERPNSGTLPALVLAVVAGCSRDPGVAPLHARASFSGTVRVTVEEAGGSWRGEADLAFDRAAGNFQVAVRDGGRTVALSRVGPGEVRRFVDGIPAPPRPGEPAARMLALLEELVGPPAAGVRTEPCEGGYVVVSGARRLRVELIEAAGVHGAGHRPESGR